jgi:transposase
VGRDCGTIAPSIYKPETRVNKNKYKRHCLKPEVIEQLKKPGVIFMQDNATCHTACRKFLISKGVNVCKWPARSPKYNPIENLWDEMNRRMSEEKDLDSYESIKAVIMKCG